MQTVTHPNTHIDTQAEMPASKVGDSREIPEPRNVKFSKAHPTHWLPAKDSDPAGHLLLPEAEEGCSAPHTASCLGFLVYNGNQR